MTGAEEDHGSSIVGGSGALCEDGDAEKMSLGGGTAGSFVAVDHGEGSYVSRPAEGEPPEPHPLEEVEEEANPPPLLPSRNSLGPLPPLPLPPLTSSSLVAPSYASWTADSAAVALLDIWPQKDFIPPPPKFVVVRRGGEVDGNGEAEAEEISENADEVLE